MNIRFVVALAIAATAATACSDSTSPPNPSAFSSSAGRAALTSPNFALLGMAAVTCTDATIIGNVATFLAPPTGAVTQTRCSVLGSVHQGDAAAVQAFNDFLAAYAALAPKPTDSCIVESGTLAGLTLAPGSYCFPAAATLTGTLTLSGPPDGIWRFKVGTLGTGALTGTTFDVVMAGGGQACNVTWWVSQAATMTDSHFAGSILAGAAITTTGGTLNGNAWSKAGVTVTSSSTVTGCAKVALPSTGDSKDKDKNKDKDGCNQGIGNGSEGCDPGNSNHKHGSNDEDADKRGKSDRGR